MFVYIVKLSYALTIAMHLIAITGGYFLFYTFANDVIDEYMPSISNDRTLSVLKLCIQLVVRSYIWVIGLLHVGAYGPYIASLIYQRAAQA